MAARKSPAQERERPREHASGGPRAGGAGSQERALLVGAAFGVGRPGTGGPRVGESRGVGRGTGCRVGAAVGGTHLCQEEARLVRVSRRQATS